MPVKRPSAVDFWEDPIDYTGPKEDDQPQQPQPENQLTQEQRQEQLERRRAAAHEREEYEELPPSNKNLNPTCVTPHIANLARPFFSHLIVAGPNPQETVDGLVERKLIQHSEYKQFLSSLLQTVHSPPPRIFFKREHLIRARSQRNLWSLYGAVRVDDELYELDDIVIVPAGDDGKNPTPEFPRQLEPNSKLTVGDFFWFAKILSIRSDDNTAHVQWFQHGRKTILDELAHPQEVFLTDLCDNIPLKSILQKCHCKKLLPGKRPGTLLHRDFFYSLCYEQTNASFTDNENLHIRAKGMSSSEICPLCAATKEASNRSSFSRVYDANNNAFAGLKYQDDSFHRWDTIMIASKDSHCDIGQIISIAESLTAQDIDSYIIDVRLFGRVIDIVQDEPELTADIHEDRHLFLTDEKIRITSANVVGKCYVLHRDSIRNLKTWLSSSSTHFFVKNRAPSRKQASKAAMNCFPCNAFVLCEQCMTEKLRKVQSFSRYNSYTDPLRVFDPFAGVGAFPLGMSQIRCIKLTHAIEINSSAAKTLKKNSPDTIVYNQCSNKMLEYAVTKLRDARTTLNDLEKDKKLPPPPRRGDIDCIVSGFPCQPHSKLNKFQKARDLRNELFLTTLSWVDHLRPRYCLFENVQGFTDFKLNATQKTRYTITGGIEQGGIKFVVKALITLGYQVRFGILQAAHYGTPQSRIRFFLWAAQAGYPLPEFPLPTHSFAPTSARFMTAGISFTNGDLISRIDTSHGIAPLPFVTVRDAISDLKRWDWENPHKKYKHVDPEERARALEVITIRVRRKDPHCGLEGAGVDYEHPPKSAFQARCRLQHVEDIQHITQNLKEEIVECTVNISLQPGANYKSLGDKPDLWQYMLFDPSSANASKGHKKEYYGRLDPDKYFSTIVTNVNPTAEQGKVLNPWCKRILSVRELARAQGFPDSFRFYALDNNVRTMHKHIGNAVPWPVGEALAREFQKALYEHSIRKEGMIE